MTIKLPYGLRLAREGMLHSKYRIKVGACLIDKGRVIIAHNIARTDPYSKWSGYKFENQLHAEYNLFSRLETLLIKSGEFTSTEPFIKAVSSRAVVYVYREHSLTKLPLLAKPCKACITFLKRVGVKKIMYTTNNEYIKETI